MREKSVPINSLTLHEGGSVTFTEVDGEQTTVVRCHNHAFPFTDISAAGQFAYQSYKRISDLMSTDRRLTAPPEWHGTAVSNFVDETVTTLPIPTVIVTYLESDAVEGTKIEVRQTLDELKKKHKECHAIWKPVGQVACSVQNISDRSSAANQ